MKMMHGKSESAADEDVELEEQGFNDTRVMETGMGGSTVLYSVI
jgi:hypothetical protein